MTIRIYTHIYTSIYSNIFGVYLREFAQHFPAIVQRTLKLFILYHAEETFNKLLDCFRHITM